MRRVLFSTSSTCRGGCCCCYSRRICRRCGGVMRMRWAAVRRRDATTSVTAAATVSCGCESEWRCQNIEPIYIFKCSCTLTDSDATTTTTQPAGDCLNASVCDRVRGRCLGRFRLLHRRAPASRPCSAIGSVLVSACRRRGETEKIPSVIALFNAEHGNWNRRMRATYLDDLLLLLLLEAGAGVGETESRAA